MKSGWTLTLEFENRQSEAVERSCKSQQGLGGVRGDSFKACPDTMVRAEENIVYLIVEAGLLELQEVRDQFSKC